MHYYIIVIIVIISGYRDLCLVIFINRTFEVVTDITHAAFKWCQ